MRPSANHPLCGTPQAFSVPPSEVTGRHMACASGLIKVKPHGCGDMARAFYDYVEAIPQESWPGLSQPSTPCLLICRKKDVDARDERGHDVWGERANHIVNCSNLMRRRSRSAASPPRPYADNNRQLSMIR